MNEGESVHDVIDGVRIDYTIPPVLTENNHHKVIGKTNSGKPVHFGFTEGGAGGDRYTSSDHHEAMTLHEKEYNRAASEASRLKSIGHNFVSERFRKIAAHHVQTSKKHWDAMNKK